MKTWVVITDLTRMQGKRVCLAGYTADCTCVRPVFRRPNGLTEDWLQASSQGIIRPFSVVEFDLQQAMPEPPHTEDWLISPVYRVKRVLAPEGQRALLERIKDPSIEAIPGTAIHDEQGWYVNAGEGSRSLGTVEPKRVEGVHYIPREGGKSEYRLTFIDAEGKTYRLAVTDLAFRYYLDHMHAQEGIKTQEIARRLTANLQEAQTFLRIGLTRGWEKHPDRCYLQITGIHTFPDYLEGRCYADFPQSQPSPRNSGTDEEIPF